MKVCENSRFVVKITTYSDGRTTILCMVSYDREEINLPESGEINFVLDYLCNLCIIKFTNE